MRLRYTLSMAAVALAVAAAPTLAHHGWSGNGQEEFEIVGTVERDISLAGPHATMQIRADDRVWDITLAPGARTRRAGLTEGVIPLGAQVTIHGHRSGDPDRYEIKAERVTWNGRTFDVYPNRD